MEISVNKWDDFNPRKELKTMTWFRINADIGYSETLFKLNPEQKWLWIFILSTCARKNKGVILVDFDFFEHNSGVSAKNIEKYIQVFEKRGLVTITIESGTNANESGLYIQTNKHTDTSPERDCGVDFSNEISAIVTHLNDATGKNFRVDSKKSKSIILARLHDKYSLSDFLHVIDVKARDVETGEFKEMYMRPQTLFSEAHFESYLNQEKQKSITDILREGETNVTEINWEIK